MAELGAKVSLWNIVDPVMGNEGLYMSDTQAYRDADLDGDNIICGLGLTVTPEMITQDLIAQIETLVADGVLTSGQGNSLTTQLDQAPKKADKGGYTAAINVATTFIDHVNDLIADGALTSEDGQPLIDGATFLIESWSTM